MKTCSREGCNRPVRTRNLCKSHYATQWEREKHGLGMRPPASGECQEDGCGRPVRAKGRCRSHYSTWHRQRRRDGRPAGPDPRFLDMEERLVARLGPELGRSEARRAFQAFWEGAEEVEEHVQRLERGGREGCGCWRCKAWTR